MTSFHIFDKNHNRCSVAAGEAPDELISKLAALWESLAQTLKNFSDIWGELKAEHWASGKNDWRLGVRQGLEPATAEYRKFLGNIQKWGCLATDQK